MAIEFSGEDEDRQNLIDQNDTMILPTHPTTFHVDQFHTRVASRPHIFPNRFVFNKTYILAFCLLILFVIVYFSIAPRHLFTPDINSTGDRMRESELQALYLLRKQQLGLFTLWNRTLDEHVFLDLNSTTHVLNTSSISPKEDLLSIEDLKATILKQISLNKDIQHILLSSHKPNNFSDTLDGNLDYPSNGIGMCQKVDQKRLERRTIEWNPKLNKFMIAICLSGQMSNHLVCLEKHMFFAALIDRVLVIPSSKVDYMYSRVLDIGHINKCLGRNVVITFEEFSEMKKNDLRIDRLMCYFSSPVLCYLDEEHIKKLKALGISMGKIESAWNEDIKKPSKRTVEELKATFSLNEDVIAIGDVFYADVEHEWVTQSGGPLAHTCTTLIEPSHLIIITAQRFVQTFLGKNFLAVHFRRHGFLKFCNAKKLSCFFPIPQAADCIRRVLERANSPVVYLSTDSADSETNLLQSLVAHNGEIVPLVKRPNHESAEKWDALLYRHGLQQDKQVEAMLDKTICAMSQVFIGSSGSTFTEDILRLRKDWGSATICDEYICQGQVPNIIADDE